MATRRKRALGNDPFQRGAAVRQSAEGEGHEAAEAKTPAGGAAPRQVRAAGAEPAAVKATTAKPAPVRSSTRKPATTKASRPAAKKARSSKAEAPAAQKTAARKVQARKSAAKKATAPKATVSTAPRTQEAAPTVAVQAAAEEAQAAPPTAEDHADLLPPNPTHLPAEPRVVAVPHVPPASPAPPLLRGHPRTTDAAAAALVALRQLVGLVPGAPSFDVDAMGYDPNLEEQVRPLLDWIYDRWFRVDLLGGERLPQSGPIMLVANRAGTLPWDSAMLALGSRRLGRVVRPLIEDDVFHLPALGVLINRLGAVRACPENAEYVLGDGGAVAVFPEGSSGVGKHFRERYRLQRFGRGGFARLALRTGARIVPVAIVGSEETQPLLGRIPARALGLPFLPITPTFPWLGLPGLTPLPSKWQIEIGDPIDLSSHGPEAADDDPLVLRLTEFVRGTIQAMLDERLSQRRSIFS